jgi:hypothetical protein
MVNEIILRIVDRKLHQLQREIADVLEADFKVRLVDDSVLNPNLLGVFHSFKQIIVISQDIVIPENVDKKRVSHFKISRVFNENGEHIGWFVPTISKSMITSISSLKEVLRFTEGQACIVDSDIATGSTKSLALQLFPGADFFAPIMLGPAQDLIDVEDLVSERSLVWKNGRFLSVSYLLNELFFCKRTSVPADKFFEISGIARKVR